MVMLHEASTFGLGGCSLQYKFGHKSKEKGDVLKHASDAGDAGDAGYLLKTYNQPCNSLLMSALYETMNSDAGKY